MTSEDLFLIRRVATQKMNGLSASTVEQYQRSMTAWEKYTQKVSLAEYSVQDVIRWHQRPGNTKRAAAFPVRCVEMLQAIAPETVSSDFFIPQGLWQGREVTYRKKVIPREELQEAIRHCIQEIEATTILTRTTAIPFLLLLTLRTAMNVEAAATLTRDCCVDRDDGGYVLQWFKGRSGKSLSGEFHPMEWGPREIVTRVQELSHDPEYLWVVSDSRKRPWVPADGQLRDWFRERGLRPFTLKEIRPAIATVIYEQTGNIAAVRDFLHHKSIATTVLYLAEYVVRPEAEKNVAFALDEIARKAGLL